jgi:hypothetical protein
MLLETRVTADDHPCSILGKRTSRRRPRRSPSLRTSRASVPAMRSRSCSMSTASSAASSRRRACTPTAVLVLALLPSRHRVEIIYALNIYQTSNCISFFLRNGFRHVVCAAVVADCCACHAAPGSADLCWCRQAERRERRASLVEGRGDRLMGCASSNGSPPEHDDGHQEMALPQPAISSEERGCNVGHSPSSSSSTFLSSRYVITRVGMYRPWADRQ